MKKHVTALISVALLAALLTGCGTTSREQELEEKVEQLEQQITDMQGGTADTSNGTDAAAGSAANDAADSGSSDTAANPAADDFDTLTQRVADAVASADAASPTGTAEENRSVFFEQKTALDTLDRELDAYEDALEAQYRSGALDYADFRKQDREVEDLENQLDQAEDRLENRFGIDD